MSLFEIVLASQIRASRQRDKQRSRLETELPRTTAQITPLAVAAVLVAITIVTLDAAGERYQGQLAVDAVAATRQ